MSSDQISVAVTRRLPDAVETRLSELFDVKRRDSDDPMTRSELAEAVKTVDVLVPTVTDRIDAALLAQAGSRAGAASPPCARDLRPGWQLQPV